MPVKLVFNAQAACMIFQCWSTSYRGRSRTVWQPDGSSPFAFNCSYHKLIGKDNTSFLSLRQGSCFANKDCHLRTSASDSVAASCRPAEGSSCRTAYQLTHYRIACVQASAASESTKVLITNLYGMHVLFMKNANDADQPKALKQALRFGRDQFL